MNMVFGRHLVRKANIKMATRQPLVKRLSLGDNTMRVPSDICFTQGESCA
jgi:hypothetical protein